MEFELIQQLDSWLSAHRPDYYSRLQAGVSSSTLDEFEARFSVQLPESFRAFYQWRNGQATACFDSFENNRMFSSLEEITETKEVLDEMIGADFEDPRWWRLGWIPFLANGGGDHLCLDVRAVDGGTPGQVIAYWHDWDNRSIEHPSFEKWLSSLVTSMEAGTLKLA
jgi:cell wall assembly regulator SMI1